MKAPCMSTDYPYELYFEFTDHQPENLNLLQRKQNEAETGNHEQAAEGVKTAEDLLSLLHAFLSRALRPVCFPYSRRNVLTTIY
jgi:hypothetical protein